MGLPSVAGKIDITKLEFGVNKLMLQCRDLSEHEINKDLFRHFIRHQVVTKCWRKVEGQWIIQENPFIDDWTDAEFEVLIKCLKNTVHTGGLVHGVFDQNKLKGFVSVENRIFGGQNKYLDLSSIHVSEDMRHQGIGSQLFLRAKDWAKAHGANKLYISAHSAVESQAFYKSMGCVEAKAYHQGHVEKEPWDCQLECVL